LLIHFTAVEAYSLAISDFYAKVFAPLLENAGDEDFVGLSVEHANFQSGVSSANPKKHHHPAFFVNKHKKSLIRWTEFTEALEKVAQSNADFVLDGQMTIRLYVTQPKTSGGKPTYLSKTTCDQKGLLMVEDDSSSEIASGKIASDFVEAYSIISETYTEDDQVYLEDRYLASRLEEHFQSLKNHHIIKNTDESCGWLAFALGKFIADSRFKASTYSRFDRRQLQKLTCPKDNYAYLRSYLLTLVGDMTEVDIDAPMTESDLSLLQKRFTDYKIIVYHRPLRRENVQLRVMFSDPQVSTLLQKKIVLEFVRREEGQRLHSHGGHFNTIDPKYIQCYCPTRAVTKPRYFCFHCNKPLRQEHNCNKKSCQVCGSEPACLKTEFLECEQCGLRPVSATCYQKHKKIQCRKFIKCPKCEVSVPTRSYHKHINSKCAQQCQHCFKSKDKYPHYCQLEGKPIDLLKKQDSSTRIQITYDIECSINDLQNSGHEPYLLCALVACDACYDFDSHTRRPINCTVCKQEDVNNGQYTWRGSTCVDDFYDFVKSMNKRCPGRKLDVYAHNASSYDAQYLMSSVYSDPETDLDKVSFVINGTKILKIGVGDSIRFYDSVLIFQQSLSSLPKSFGFERIVKKGHSPLGLLLESNRSERAEHDRGSFPEERYFFTKFMTEKQYSDFLVWYKMQKLNFETSGECYDFETELESYCQDDCRVLMAA